MENALLKKYHTELRKSLLAKRNIGSSTTIGREYEVKAMCAFFGVSRAAYYAWVKREQADPDAGRKELIQKAYQASHRTYGYRRVSWWIAQNCGVTINHKAVLRLINKLGIHSVARKRRIIGK